MSDKESIDISGLVGASITFVDLKDQAASLVPPGLHGKHGLLGGAAVHKGGPYYVVACNQRLYHCRADAFVIHINQPRTPRQAGDAYAVLRAITLGRLPDLLSVGLPTGPGSFLAGAVAGIAYCLGQTEGQVLEPVLTDGVEQALAAGFGADPRQKLTVSTEEHDLS